MPLSMPAAAGRAGRAAPAASGAGRGQHHRRRRRGSRRPVGAVDPGAPRVSVHRSGPFPFRGPRSTAWQAVPGADGHPPGHRARRRARSTRLAVRPASDQNTGAGVPSGHRRGVARARAVPRRRMRLPDWWEAAISTGKVAAALSSSTLPAWIPPISGSARRSTTGRPSRSPTISPDRPVAEADARFEVGEDQVPGHPEGLDRAQDPRPGQRPPPGGHAEVEPVGHGPEPAPGPDGGPRRPDRDQLVGEAELAAQLGGLGPAGQEGVGGQVDRAGRRTRPDRSLPPSRSADSSTTTSGTTAPAPGPPPAAASGPATSSHAAASPAIPPPTTAMVGRR